MVKQQEQSLKVKLWSQSDNAVLSLQTGSADTSAVQVVELAQEMTPAMITIYDAIVDLMDACIKELKRANKIDTSEMTLEECLFRSFDDMVRRQLDPVWHTITPKTKQVRSSSVLTCMQHASRRCRQKSRAVRDFMCCRCACTSASNIKQVHWAGHGRPLRAPLLHQNTMQGIPAVYSAVEAV